MAKKNYKPKTNEERQEELQGHYEKLIKGVKEASSNPEDYMKYLNFVSKFPQRSLRNQMLIYMQKPDAHLVAGLKTWNKFGRQVNKGSEGIKIFAPITKKEKVIDEYTKKEVENNVIKGFRMVNVFDVNDTNGVPLPTAPLVPKNVKESEFAQKTFQAIVEELRKELPIEMDKNYSRDSNGYYSRLEHKIVVNANSHRDITNQYKTLIHEYAHAVFHNETGKYKDYDRESKEVQAESVAYMTTKSFGMDTSDYSFAYIKGWAAEKDEKLLLNYQEDIHKESAKLIKKIEDVIVDRNISFDVPAVLDSNTTSIEDGEQPISLIQYGDTYTIAKGQFLESSLNSLEGVKQLGVSFNDKETAERYFEISKGHVPLQGAEKIDKEKGKIHAYQRTLIDPTDKIEKNMYFVGVASFTNIKALSSLTSEKELAMSTLKRMTSKEIGIGEKQKIDKDLSMRDRDGDGLTDYEEKETGTNLTNRDTDGDGISDNRDTSPRSATGNQPELDLSL
ncbi:thrombospondin type 3 repeat-containing protein [Peribacillus muralis]|uniref:ArdC-like ssDNA-binding domain-containing protein n=1 Tax=Peribacillus muralis TaxID=264697 RepID=UPI001F4E95BE|nr:ArdC-like ssDNA-binding domain-containing protein [Peribacillus muralis]MCK1995475.1 thrombospondin type 3 repeat-containing protein [Peribacillus muralis]MCK2016058.1 thrombospondin type 3 repeat-containing protein [Peribacillus muralis]